MNVWPIEGEPRRFHVESDELGREPFLVDLDEYNGNGWCGCEDFEFRRQPLLERGAEPGTERCKHIECALRYQTKRKNESTKDVLDQRTDLPAPDLAAV